MFITIHDRETGEKVLINVDQIAIVWEKAETLCMAGVHGGGNGLIHTDKEGMYEVVMAVAYYARQDR